MARQKLQPRRRPPQRVVPLSGPGWPLRKAQVYYPFYNCATDCPWQRAEHGIEYGAWRAVSTALKNKRGTVFGKVKRCARLQSNERTLKATNLTR